MPGQGIFGGILVVPGCKTVAEQLNQDNTDESPETVDDHICLCRAPSCHKGLVEFVGTGEGYTEKSCKEK